ncbi:uncharacterized protein LOC132561344 [Ylistrum balloti]|uniref:uncharacterized protein LOC132561344 n=1 Tax=Ylistrum balloti TaxID=509963 RepID=UPI002905ED09|nr:uncharacterized protein LOC132561344 [Ylistrum balloti]XP_060082051.1 uncharacterized protein LOC132561344 [Ylistrum balloti]XP_060082052.1 uncharacterized protein LOC132561344 [Ylistrum balloti]XP_060082053.1 uncharacterized protein LOC132561344 [Ylistrum balloti]XP_060082054.1 uncharacterized protein LOC132561344 [Ylistrum balloti]
MMEICSCDVLTILLGFYLFTVSNASVQNIFVSGCSRETIELGCPLGHKIAIKRLFYGVKTDRKCADRGRKHKSDCCRRTYDDCLIFNEDKYNVLNIMCSGYRNCEVDVKRINTRGECDNPEWRLTDYMTVIYDCVSDTDVARFCSNDHKRGKELYLSNLDYPSPIVPGPRTCRCVLKSGYTQGLSIHAIDIMITRPEDSQVCTQSLSIQDTYGQTKIIRCGHGGLYGFRTIYNRMVTNVSLELKSNVNDSRGYIWLHLKSENTEDFVNLYCGEAISSLTAGPVTNTSVTPNPTKVPPVGNNTVYPSKGWSTPHLIPDMVAIIGGIAAAVALILLVCLVAIAVHCTRVRERRHPKIPEVIPSPMVRGKSYDNDEPDATIQRYNYDEERYCSIKRSPMKMTKYSEFDGDSDKKLKEAFLAPDNTPEDDGHLVPNGAPPRPPSPDPALLDMTPPPVYNGEMEKYYTMHPQKPKTEIAEIRVTSSLPHRGKIKKSVTFSPVAMVTPLPSGSEESIGSDGDRNLANVIDIYQNLQGKHGPGSPDLKEAKHVLILPPPPDENSVPVNTPDPLEMAEMEELWKTLTTTTMDEGAYDNIEYLLAQNRANNHREVNGVKPKSFETGV